MSPERYNKGRSFRLSERDSVKSIQSLNLKLLFHLVKAWGSSLSCHLRLFEEIEYEFLNHELPYNKQYDDLSAADFDDG